MEVELRDFRIERGVTQFGNWVLGLQGLRLTGLGFRL